ncbi:MAG TPA: thioredoxin family protein [Haliscomenobacter sp.]|uniref:thioredoxin family protein n=1 Tax=Haliscomenobacter sp. TaxID=2717303 RepID=UPI002C7FFF10|nr:thioredoxin family protein [Haliscomenobacter sp.]HOY17710.1 thioredoxin family protein [Haliscomenobacter sp.]
MKQIKILGTGCPKCKTTVANALEAVKQSGIEAEVIKIEDIQEIMAYNILSTPALVIDETVKIKGRVASVEEIKTLLIQ